MENKKRFICWVHDEKSSFPVHIDPENTICKLKNAIFAKKRNCFREIDSHQLELYVANIPDTKEAMLSFSFAELNMPAGSDEIIEYFPGRLPKNTIHFAIKRPCKQYSFILSTHIC
jgi:hypothetical protein